MSQKTDLEIGEAMQNQPKKERMCCCMFATKKEKYCCILKGVIISALFVLLPFYFVYAVAAWLFCGIDVSKQRPNPFSSQSDDGDDDNIYLKVTEMQDKAHKIAHSLKFARSRMVAFVLIWVILNLSIPRLRRITLLGSYLWKWTLLLAVIVCGYHIISLATSSVLSFLVNCSWFKSYKSALYFAQGLRVSVNLVAHSWTVLATWVFYFKTSEGLKTTSPDKTSAFHVGTWTFAMLAVIALMWLFKKAMLLVWEANAIYTRFGDRILNTGFYLYFVGYICAWDKDKEKNKEKLKTFQPKKKSDDKNNSQESDQSKRRTDHARFYDGVSIYHIMQMTKDFINLSKVSSREVDGTSDVLDKCRRIIHPDNASKKTETENIVKTCDRVEDATLLNDLDNASKKIAAKDLEEEYGLEEEDAKLLCSDLNIEHQQQNSDTFLYGDFEKAMVRGHKNCLALGHTLADAAAVVDVLDKITTCILITLAVIAWLLLADITTNNVLVLIASPFLAATFIFGDTCKKTFEGLIFSFISHPFDVGDLCVIDDLELEVKRMGIWTTKFILIATKEEVLQPNSELATKSIKNLKGEPDPSDCVELTLDSSLQPHLASLRNKITNFFENNGGKRFEKEASTSVEEIGSSIRLTVRYKNVMSIHEVTHSQCYEKKRKQRSDLLMEMAHYVNEIDKN